MTEFDSDPLEGHDLEDRDVRALTRKVTVLRIADDLYSVTTDSGSEYTVDMREPACRCPDFEYRDHVEKCYHIRRVEFATGERVIPSWCDRDAVDPQLGDHVSGPEWGHASDESRSTVVADGGAVTESAPSDTDPRPEDCQCEDWQTDIGLPCWPCYREGYDSPAPTDN